MQIDFLRPILSFEKHLRRQFVRWRVTTGARTKLFFLRRYRSGRHFCLSDTDRSIKVNELRTFSYIFLKYSDFYTPFISRMRITVADSTVIPFTSYQCENVSVSRNFCYEIYIQNALLRHVLYVV